MCNISGRLLEERKKLGLTQDEFAVIGGVSKRAYCNYEGSSRVPDANFLSAIAEAGADVNYILTGHRAQLINEDNPGYTLRPDQKALLDNLEHCALEDQDAIKRMALMCAGAAHRDEAQQKKVNDK